MYRSYLFPHCTSRSLRLNSHGPMQFIPCRRLHAFHCRPPSRQAVTSRRSTCHYISPFPTRPLKRLIRSGSTIPAPKKASGMYDTQPLPYTGFRNQPSCKRKANESQKPCRIPGTLIDLLRWNGQDGLHRLSEANHYLSVCLFLLGPCSGVLFRSGARLDAYYGRSAAFFYFIRVLVEIFMEYIYAQITVDGLHRISSLL